MSNKILLSVVIPVYNGEKYISNLLDRLCKDLTEGIELIIIDDGSNDYSVEKIKPFVNGNTSVKLVTQKNMGAASARQRGLDCCNGEYITFIDCDDWIKEGYLETIKILICNNLDVDIFVTSYRTIYSEKCIFNRINENKIYSNTRDYVINIMNGTIKGENALWNHIYKLDFLKTNNIKFNLKSKIAEDSLFNDLCILAKPIIMTSSYDGYVWKCGHESLTGRCPDNMCETLNKHIHNLEKIIEVYKIDKRIYLEYYISVKKWSFEYYVNNIINSRFSKRKKRQHLKTALFELLDEDIATNRNKKNILYLIAMNKKSILPIYINYYKNKALAVVGYFINKTGRIFGV